MDAFNQEQFWQALQRLYDTTLEHSKQIESLIRILESHENRLGRLEGGTE